MSTIASTLMAGFAWRRAAKDPSVDDTPLTTRWLEVRARIQDRTNAPGDFQGEVAARILPQALITVILLAELAGRNELQRDLLRLKQRVISTDAE